MKYRLQRIYAVIAAIMLAISVVGCSDALGSDKSAKSVPVNLVDTSGNIQTVAGGTAISDETDTMAEGDDAASSSARILQLQDSKDANSSQRVSNNSDSTSESGSEKNAVHPVQTSSVVSDATREASLEGTAEKAAESSNGIELYTFWNINDSEKQKAQIAVNSLNIGEVSEYEKVKAIHDYLVNSIAYPEYIPSGGNSSVYHASGAFTGSAVCMGYADAFSLMCYYAGIQADVVSSESMNHAWNQVRIDGTWYNIDVTWDDPYGTPQVCLYNYFLLSDSDIAKDHYGMNYYGRTKNCPYTYDAEGNISQSISTQIRADYPSYSDYEILYVTDMNDIETRMNTVNSSKTCPVIIVYGNGVEVTYSEIVTYAMRNYGYSNEYSYGTLTTGNTVYNVVVLKL